MHQTPIQANENATMMWLEAALEHAYSHDQLSVLAYLEAVMEDLVLEEEMAPVFG